MNYLHDFLSACLVRLRSLGVGLGPAAFVAVFTSDSRISSSPSVKFSSVCRSNGDRILLGLCRRNDVKMLGLSIVSTFGFGEPRSCLNFIKRLIHQTKKSIPCRTNLNSQSARSSWVRNLATSMIILPRVLFRSR